jgi:hypothetical protein
LRRHAVEALAALAVAVLLTLIIAAPVVRAPSERIFGAEIVGRHHDPFTVMQQFASRANLGLYSQPVTDLTGAAIARTTGAVAAYDWLVLLSFPLSAAAAYLLARHCALSPGAALFAALLFAFSPFHLAHAAYHPHIAQTHWLPLYLLALWRCMDEATWIAAAVLAVAAAAAALSNFYGGLIAAVITPIAVVAYWRWRARFGPHAWRHLRSTVAALAGLACAGMTWIWSQAPFLIRDRAAFAFPREELFIYSAKWWSYLVPPVGHPMLGGLARRIWSDARVTDGLLEQQVSLGWGVVALAVVAIVVWLTTILQRRAKRSAADGGRRPSGPRVVDAVPVFVIVAAAAVVCSLSPETTLFGVTIARPSSLLYPVVPMFRSYARFGVVVQLMAGLLAGIGAAHLFAAGARSSRLLAMALVTLTIVEYGVRPSALWRDVLPTAAHRWVMQQTAALRVFDCEPLTAASASIAWLTDGRITNGDQAGGDCAEPQLAAKLWAAGFTHLLVRDTWERQWLRKQADGQGLHLQARFADADVFSLKPRTLVYTQTVDGFWPREHSAGTTWRWMSEDASWIVVSPAPQPRLWLELELQAFQVGRPLTVRLDEGVPQTLHVDPDPRTYRLGPLALPAGSHRFTFHSAAPATIADGVIGNGDGRALAISLRRWQWSAE